MHMVGLLKGGGECMCSDIVIQFISPLYGW